MTFALITLSIAIIITNLSIFIHLKTKHDYETKSRD